MPTHAFIRPRRVFTGAAVAFTAAALLTADPAFGAADRDHADNEPCCPGHGADAGTLPAGDVNGDGLTNGADLVALLGDFGRSCQ